MQKSNESGRSMVEMLGVIAIIGVISVGAITSMSYVDSYFRSSATLMEIEQIARDINDMYSWAPDYSELNNMKLCEEKIVENCTNSKIPNRWGGKLSVEPISDPVGFEIQLTQVPEAACVRLVQQAPDTLVSVSVRTHSCNNGDNNTVVFESN